MPGRNAYLDGLLVDAIDADIRSKLSAKDRTVCLGV